VRGTYLFYIYGQFDVGYILVYVALKRLQVDFLPYATGHIRGRWNISGLQWQELILVCEGSGGVYFPLAVATYDSYRGWGGVAAGLSAQGLLGG